MSQYYNPKRKSYLYTPGSLSPFRLSRSKIDLFLNCPKCFYFDRRLGVGQPPGYPFSLNSAVDKLLKKESKNISEAIFESSERNAYEAFGAIKKLSKNNFQITLKNDNSEFLNLLCLRKDRLIRYSELKPTLEEIIYKSER